jgi:ABC-type multidrug transport system fused ATPase/permease subunit
MTALVGASGSGKSTLVDVLLGLLPPTSGGVLVDGVPLAELRRYWLRVVGYVPQSVFLMSASIRENVALGLPDDQINDDMVWQALRRASMGDTVEALPGGLDYHLGDTGSGLSGGQRQRLGIARALYHSPQVLILDEATSALDVETEAEITDTLAQLDGLTKIVVAHRLSTVKHAEQVLFLRAGQVVANGSFAEVSAAVPDFARQVELSGMRASTGT